MDLLPAALFLVPGAFATVGHRFASAQRLSSGTQLLLAVAYSGLTYMWLASPMGDPLRTPVFPSSLFGSDASALAQPDTALRLLITSIVATAFGLVIGRLSMSRRVHDLTARLTGRNLYSSVWSETFRNAPRQWIRFKSDEIELVGWLESASDDPDERAVVVSHVHEMRGSRPQRVVGNIMYLRADAFPVVVLLGKDVAQAISDARAAGASALRA